ncbi:MAG: adenylyl-sulfate kinase [Chitinophagaceae bacterium]
MLLIQLTGLSGAGKSTIAGKVKDLLDEAGLPSVVIDGDEYRKTLCKDLGFSKDDRFENIRRLGKLAFSFTEKGIIAIIAAINPFEEIRKELRDEYGAKTVWVNCGLEELIRRDTKGLYKKALLPDNSPDKIHNLTGINDTFEEPAGADLVLSTTSEMPAESAEKLYQFILSILQR